MSLRHYEAQGIALTVLGLANHSSGMDDEVLTLLHPTLALGSWHLPLMGQVFCVLGFSRGADLHHGNRDSATVAWESAPGPVSSEVASPSLGRGLRWP